MQGTEEVTGLESIQLGDNPCRRQTDAPRRCELAFPRSFRSGHGIICKPAPSPFSQPLFTSSVSGKQDSLEQLEGFADLQGGIVSFVNTSKKQGGVYPSAQGPPCFWCHKLKCVQTLNHVITGPLGSRTSGASLLEHLF